MQEVIGANDDILFDLEQIKLISQGEVRLTDAQKDKVNRLPRKKQEDVKKEILAKKEQEKKTFLRIWTLELEDKVKKSDLPPEVVSQILEMTSYAKDRNMTFIYDIERKIETLKEQVKEAERKKLEEAMEKDRAVMGAVTGAVIGAVVAGAVLSPYVQVRYDKEEFEKRSETYLEEKIIPKLAMAAEKPVVPLEPLRTYPKKLGSMYPRSELALKEKHKSEWMDALVKMVQDKAKAEGKTPPAAAEIIASYENSTEMEKKITNNALKKKNPKLAAQQKQEEKIHDQAVIAKGIERLRRKKAKTAAKIERAQKRQMTQAQQKTQGKKTKGSGKQIEPKQKEKEARAKAREKMQQQVALKKARLQSKGPRIAERERTEKPITITKEAEQKTERPQRPVVAKEEEKQLGKVKDFAKTPEGMAARTEAVREQITENKGPERLYDKGFSKFLAVAQERVQNQSKELSETADKRRQELQEKINKEGPNFFINAQRKYAKTA